MREMGAFKPGEMVGGTAAHWAAMRAAFSRMISKCTRASRNTMAHRSFPRTAICVDWGVTWDEVEPHYDQFERYPWRRR